MATNLFSPAGDRGVESWCREPEDGHLLALAKSGQAAAFAELCRSYAKKNLRTTEDSGAIGWSRNRGQRSESGKALPGARAGAACAKGNPRFATQHLRSSGDAALARLFGRGNRARDGHLGWRRQASAVSRQEGPAQSSEPEKHRR